MHNEYHIILTHNIGALGIEMAPQPVVGQAFFSFSEKRYNSKSP
jgi:hypothetical protein